MTTFEEIDFLIIGAAKSATTSLQFALQSDHRISMPCRDLELHYFSRNFDRGEDWYLSQLPRQATTARIGERSNSYMSDGEACRRIASHLPHVRLIAQLRHPVDRAYSDYCMLYRRGEVGPNVETLLDPRLAANDRLVSDGDYHLQLVPFFDHFPRQQFQLLLYEDFRTDPVNVVERVQAFLGLTPDTREVQIHRKAKDKTIPVVRPGLKRRARSLKPIIEALRGNFVFEHLRASLTREVAYPPLTAGLRGRLLDYYLPSIERLSKLTGLDLSSWTGSGDAHGVPAAGGSALP